MPGGAASQVDKSRHVLATPRVVAIALVVATAASLGFLPRATPDAIVFSSDCCTRSAEIYRVRPDGSGLARLTVNSTDERDPAVSPDGRRIAYASDASGFSQIYLMDADGTGSRCVFHSTSWDESPRWSPDGTKLVFTRLSRFADVSGIWVVNVDGTGLRGLTPRRGSDWDPDWSPDGTRIVFATRNGALRQVHTMRADGRDRRCLTRDASDKRFPRWSPDGRRIAYSAVGTAPARASIHVVRADGTGDVALTTGATEDGRPTWSPDGARIVFQSGRGGARSIRTMSADGSDLRRVTSGDCPGSDRSLDWGPTEPVGLLRGGPWPATRAVL